MQYHAKHYQPDMASVSQGILSGLTVLDARLLTDAIHQHLHATSSCCAAAQPADCLCLCARACADKRHHQVQTASELASPLTPVAVSPVWLLPASLEQASFQLQKTGPLLFGGSTELVALTTKVPV